MDDNEIDINAEVQQNADQAESRREGEPSPDGV